MAKAHFIKLQIMKNDALEAIICMQYLGFLFLPTPFSYQFLHEIIGGITVCKDYFYIMYLKKLNIGKETNCLQMIVYIFSGRSGKNFSSNGQRLRTDVESRAFFF